MQRRTNYKNLSSSPDSAGIAHPSGPNESNNVLSTAAHAGPSNPVQGAQNQSSYVASVREPLHPPTTKATAPAKGFVRVGLTPKVASVQGHLPPPWNRNSRAAASIPADPADSPVGRGFVPLSSRTPRDPTKFGPEDFKSKLMLGPSHFATGQRRSQDIYKDLRRQALGKDHAEATHEGHENVSSSRDELCEATNTHWLLPPPPPSLNNEYTWDEVLAILSDRREMGSSSPHSAGTLLPRPSYLHLDGPAEAEDGDSLGAWPNWYLDRFQPHREIWAWEVDTEEERKLFQAIVCEIDDPELCLEPSRKAQLSWLSTDLHCVDYMCESKSKVENESEDTTKAPYSQAHHASPKPKPTPLSDRTHDWLSHFSKELKHPTPLVPPPKTDPEDTLKRYRLNFNSALGKEQFHGHAYLLAAFLNGKGVGRMPEYGDFLQKRGEAGEVFYATAVGGEMGKGWYSIQCFEEEGNKGKKRGFGVDRWDEGKGKSKGNVSMGETRLRL